MSTTDASQPADRFSQLHHTMADDIARGQAPGLVTAVSAGDETRIDAIGVTELGGTTAMTRRTIFRIASMTKPITAATAMTLVEEGKAKLDDSVLPILPELAERRVLQRLDGALDDTVPAKRAITLRDLLTMRLGFGMVWGASDTPIVRAANALELQAFGPPLPSVPPPPDEYMRRLGSLPLMHQPGEVWRYNTGMDILGVFISRLTGKPLELAMRERIFAPLGMTDTAFSVPPEKITRLATSYLAKSEAGPLTLFDPAKGGQWSRPPAFPSGAGGLVSTVDDYLAFATMMMNGGAYEKTRLLQASTVKLMTTNQITPAQMAASTDSLAPGFWDEYGWGLGLAVAISATAHATGFGWDGGLGTSWYSDPAKNRTAILLTQRSAYPMTSPVYLDFWKAVNDASGRRPASS